MLSRYRGQLGRSEPSWGSQSASEAFKAPYHPARRLARIATDVDKQSEEELNIEQQQYTDDDSRQSR